MDGDGDRLTDCHKRRKKKPSRCTLFFLFRYPAMVRLCLEDRVHADPSDHFCKCVICWDCQENRC